MCAQSPWGQRCAWPATSHGTCHSTLPPPCFLPNVHPSSYGLGGCWPCWVYFLWKLGPAFLPWPSLDHPFLHPSPFFFLSHPVKHPLHPFLPFSFFYPTQAVPATMSRSDRIVNILLALAWVLLIVRVGRIYFESTSGGGGAVASTEYADEPIPSPIVLVSCAAFT